MTPPRPRKKVAKRRLASPSELYNLERRVVKRLKQHPPASFQDLIEEGLITEGQANTVRGRLRERLVVVGRRAAKTGRGRPHVLYGVVPKE